MSGATPDWAAILKKAGDAIREKRKTETGKVAIVAPAVALAAPKKSKKKAQAMVVKAELPQEKEEVPVAVAKKETKDKKEKKRKDKSEEVVPKEKKDKKGKGKAKEVPPPVVEDEVASDVDKLARRAERKAEKKRLKAEAKAKKLAKGSPMDTSDEVSPPPVTVSKKKRKRFEEDEPAPIASTSKLPPPSPAAVDSPKPKKRKRDKKAASPAPSVPAPPPISSTAPINSPQKKKKRKHEPKEPSPVAFPSPAPESPAKPKSTRARKPKAVKVVPPHTFPSIDVAAERQRVLDRVLPNILRDLRAANPSTTPAPAAMEEEVDELESQSSEVERPIAPLPKRARRLVEEGPKFAKWAKRFPAAWRALVEQKLLVEIEEKSSELSMEEEERKRGAKREKKEKKRKAKKEAASLVEEAAPAVEEAVLAVEEVAPEEAAPAIIVVKEKKRKAVESEDEASSTSGSAVAEPSTPVPRAKPRRRPSQREKEIRAQGSQDELASPSLASRAPSLSPVLASPALVASAALPIVVEPSAAPVEEDVEMADAQAAEDEVSEAETVEDEVESVKGASVAPEEEHVVAELLSGPTLIEDAITKDSEIEETDVEEKGRISTSEAGDIEDDGEEEEEDQLETTPSQLLPARQRLMSREQSIASSEDDPEEVALSLSQHVSKHATPYRPSPLVHSSQVGSDSGDELHQREEDESEDEQQHKSSATGSRQSTPIRQDVLAQSQSQSSPPKSAPVPDPSPDLAAPIPASQFPTPAQPRLQTIGGADSDSDSSSSDDSDSDDSDSDEDRPVVAKRSRPSIGSLAAEAFGKAPKSRASLFATTAKVVSQAIEVDEDFDQLLSQSLPQGVSLSAFIAAEDKEEADETSSHSSRFSSVATESRETTPAREMRELAAREVTPEDDASDEDVPAARVEAHLVPLPPSSPTPELDAPLPNGDAMDADSLPVASTSNGVPHPAPSSPVLQPAAPAPASSFAKFAPSSPVPASQQVAVNGLSAIADYPASEVGPMGTFDLGSTQGDSPEDGEVTLPEESQFAAIVKEKELFFPETQMESLSQPTPTVVSFAASPRKSASTPGPSAASSASPPKKSAPQEVEASPIWDTAALLPELEAAVAKAPSPFVETIPLPPVVAVTAALPPTPSRVTRSSSTQRPSRSPSPAPSKANGIEEDIGSKLATANQRALDAREHGPSVARRQPARLAATPSKPSAPSRPTPSQARPSRISSAPLSSQLAPASPGPSRGGRASSMRGLSALPDFPSPGEGSPRRSTRNASTNGRSQLSQGSQPMTWTRKGDDEDEEESEEEGEIRQKKVGIWG